MAVKRDAVSRRLKARSRFGKHATDEKASKEVPGVISQAEVDKGKKFPKS